MQEKSDKNCQFAAMRLGYILDCNRSSLPRSYLIDTIGRDPLIILDTSLDVALSLPADALSHILSTLRKKAVTQTITIPKTRLIIAMSCVGPGL